MGPIDKLAGRQMLLCCFGFRFLRIVPVDFEIFQSSPPSREQSGHSGSVIWSVPGGDHSAYIRQRSQSVIGNLN